MTSIVSEINNRVSNINYIEKNGTFKKHPLYPNSFKEPFRFPITAGGTLVPALNILTKEKFNKLLKEEDETSINNFKLIGTLEFYDEYVEFFGSFDNHDAIYTSLTLEEMESYELPEYFIRVIKIFKNPESFKWHHDSLHSGDPRTTVIVVLGEDGVELYRR